MIPGPVNALNMLMLKHVRPINWQYNTAEQHVIFAIEQKAGDRAVMMIPGPVNALNMLMLKHVRPINWQYNTAKQHVIFANHEQTTGHHLDNHRKGSWTSSPQSSRLVDKP